MLNVHESTAQQITKLISESDNKSLRYATICTQCTHSDCTINSVTKTTDLSSTIVSMIELKFTRHKLLKIGNKFIM